MHVFPKFTEGEAFCQHMKQFRQFLGLVCFTIALIALIVKLQNDKKNNRLL